MLLPTTLFPILICTCYQLLFVSCQLDLDPSSIDTNTSLTYLYINSDSSLQLLPSVFLSIADLSGDTITANVSTQSTLQNFPCFTNSNSPPCMLGFIESAGLSLQTAVQFLQSVYYHNPTPLHNRTVLIKVTISYQTRGSTSLLSLVAYASVLEERDFPIISFVEAVPYAPVYRHELRPVQFLDGSKFALSSQGGLFTSLLVCVYTQTGLESISVDTNVPNTNSPITFIEQNRVCSGLEFDSIDNTTLLQTFSGFLYSEKTAVVSNYNDRVMSVSVDSGTNLGNPLYFNISYYIPPSPINIQTAVVVYYEDVATQSVAMDFSFVRMSDVINISRQLPGDSKRITSLLLQSNFSHIPMVSLWNDQLCSTNRFSHPVHKFEFCSDEQFFFGIELTANFVQKFGLTKDTIVVEGRQLNIFNATEVQSYGYLTLVGSGTQTPDANHFSIWFKNAPGQLTGCPLEITNGPFVDYQICLTGSESLIQFGYSGLAPEHHEVTVSFPTDGAFRVDDWNFVSVSVTRDTISLLLNEIVLEPSAFYWFDDEGNDQSTQIPVHLYSTSFTAVTNIYILGKDSGFIGEVTGVVVDQFYITEGEAHCMFSCIEGFYVNETFIATLQTQGMEVVFVRDSFEVNGNMSLEDISYILENVFYNTPLDSSRAHRLISVTASDDTFSATESTRVSYQCTEGSCFDNTLCYTTDTSAMCLCREGYLDASTNGDMSVCKHPMDCGYLNGGCSELENCVQSGEEVRECEDACASDPCENGGTCTAVTLSEYDCTCVGEFYGADCMCRNSCLSQDCSPGECIDYCNGTFLCTTPESSSIFLSPSPTLLSASTTSYLSATSVASVQSTYSSVFAPPAVSQTASSVFIAPQTTTGSSLVAVSPSSVQISASSMQSPSSSMQIPSSSAIPSSSLILPQTSTLLQDSTQLISTSALPQSSSSSVEPIQSSSIIASQYTQVVSSVSSSQLAESSTGPIVQSASSSPAPGVISPTLSVLPSVSTTFQSPVSSSIGGPGVSLISSDIASSPSSVLFMTSPSSSVDAGVTSSADSATPSQTISPSSTVGILTSSLVIPSSSLFQVITSSQAVPSSSAVEVVTSSQAIPSSSAVEAVTSSQVIPSSSLFQFITSSQVVPSSSALEVVTSSQVIPSSSAVEAVTSSQAVPSSSAVEAVTSSQAVPSSSSVEAVTSSQVIPSSSVVEVITSSEIIPSSSVVGVITSSEVASSLALSSSVPVLQTSSASDATYSSSAVTSIQSSEVQVASSADIPSSSSTPAQSSIVASSASDSLTTIQQSSYETAIPSSTTSVVVPSSTSATQSTTQPEPSSNVAIGIGVALGIFLLILVIIAAIALVISLFLFRMSRFQNLDPTKEFEKPDSTSPAQITAVYKNKDTLVLN